MSGFYLTYLRREFRRRLRQSLLSVAGLAVGVGLAATVTAATAGVSEAETAVLHSLYGIGTDISVTKAAPHHAPATPDSTRASGRNLFSAGKKPRPVDQLTSAAGISWLDQASVASIARLPGVAAVAGGLTLTDTQFIVPSVSQEGPDGQVPASAFPVSFAIDGVGVSRPGLGPYAAATLISGQGLTAANASAAVAVADSGYAAAHRLAIGSSVTIAFRRFTVIGIVSQPPDGAADVYIPLATAQRLAAKSDMVTNIYVTVASPAAIPAVRAEVASLLPGATVSSSATLASEVSGSLNAAATISADLGRWLTAGVLATACAAAVLLALGSVLRRGRELGTLRALGWSSRRVVAQLLGESAVVGLLGAGFGAAIGLGGAAIVTAVAPTLSADVEQSPGSQPPEDVTVNGSGMHISNGPDAFRTVAVHMHATVTPATSALAAGLAMAGALIAGAAGGWRASRLQPTAAMSSVE
jgi:putative ABC transport system permease protein